VIQTYYMEKYWVNHAPIAGAMAVRFVFIVMALDIHLILLVQLYCFYNYWFLSIFHFAL
jgi:hypothetical protein